MDFLLLKEAWLDFKTTFSASAIRSSNSEICSTKSIVMGQFIWMTNSSRREEFKAFKPTSTKLNTKLWNLELSSTEYTATAQSIRMMISLSLQKEACKDFNSTYKALSIRSSILEVRLTIFTATVQWLLRSGSSWLQEEFWGCKYGFSRISMKLPCLEQLSTEYTLMGQ